MSIKSIYRSFDGTVPFHLTFGPTDHEATCIQLYRLDISIVQTVWHFFFFIVFTFLIHPISINSVDKHQIGETSPHYRGCTWRKRWLPTLPGHPISLSSIHIYIAQVYPWYPIDLTHEKNCLSTFISSKKNKDSHN
jgi:hypothetical protein